jgi:hypothetical protein
MLLIDRLVGPTNKADELIESALEGMVDGPATRTPLLPAGAWVGPRAPLKS